MHFEELEFCGNQIFLNLWYKLHDYFPGITKHLQNNINNFCRIAQMSAE